jgi:hypothetical protein
LRARARVELGRSRRRRARLLDRIPQTRAAATTSPRATERHRLARDAVYEVVITRRDEPIAEFRGHTRQFRGRAA